MQASEEVMEAHQRWKLAASDYPCSSPSGASSAAVLAGFHPFEPCEEVLAGVDALQAHWSSHGAREAQDCSSSGLQQPSCSALQVPRSPGSTGWGGQHPCADALRQQQQPGWAGGGSSPNISQKHGGSSSISSDQHQPSQGSEIASSRHHHGPHSQQLPPPQQAGSAELPAALAPPPPLAGGELLPACFSDALWLDGLPLPDLFSEGDPLSLFPPEHDALQLLPLLPAPAPTLGLGSSWAAGLVAAVHSLKSEGQDQQRQQQQQWREKEHGGTLGGCGAMQQPSAFLSQPEASEGSGASAAACEGLSTPRHRGSGIGGAGATTAQAHAANKGQGKKRGRPRLYDTTGAPVAAPAAADGGGAASGKRGRGPKPKYVFQSREEAAGARRERNRKAALDSYYRQREHVKGLEAERDRLLAENASLGKLLGELEAGGPCPLRELSDAGIDTWLSTM